MSSTRRRWGTSVTATSRARASVLVVYVDISSASSAGIECLLREDCVPGGDDILASSIGVFGRLQIIISPPKRVSVSMIIGGGVDVVDRLCWVGVGRPCWTMGVSLISLSILDIEGWLCRVLVCES